MVDGAPAAVPPVEGGRGGLGGRRCARDGGHAAVDALLFFLEVLPVFVTNIDVYALACGSVDQAAALAHSILAVDLGDSVLIIVLRGIEMHNNQAVGLAVKVSSHNKIERVEGCLFMS